MPTFKLDYQKLNKTALSGVQVTAPSLQRLFINSALALTDQVVRYDSIQEQETKKFEFSANNKEELLLEWLGEVIRLFNEEQFLCAKITFQTFDQTSIKATLIGEKHDRIRHGIGHSASSVTFSSIKMNVEDEVTFQVEIYFE